MDQSEEAEIALRFLERHKQKFTDKRINEIINYTRKQIRRHPREGHFSNPNENEVKDHISNVLNDSYNLSFLDDAEYLGRSTKTFRDRGNVHQTPEYWFKQDFRVGDKEYVAYFSIFEYERTIDRMYGNGELFVFNKNTLQPVRSRTISDYFFKTKLSIEPVRNTLPENDWFGILQDKLEDQAINVR